MRSWPANIIKDLPSSYSEEVYFNIELLKKLAYMDWNELSLWVEKMSHKKYYFARPSQVNKIDMEVCLEQSVQKILYKALIVPMHKMRKNGRDKKLLYALKKNDFDQIASILASAVRTYWQDRKYMIWALSQSYEDQNATNQ